MRQIQRDVASVRKGTVARIDFDYLSPDFPAVAPALLLEHLADELQAFATDDKTVIAFDAFASKARRLHESLTGRGQPARPFDEVVKDGEFATILDLFAEALNRLPRPLVLLIDTCEELARSLSPGGESPGVAATWGILNQLRERLPDLKVVFGGRRRLVNGREKWIKEFQEVPIGGFDRTEAEGYLVKRIPDRRDLFEAVLDHCRGGIEDKAEDESNRFNPLDLSVYTTWVLGNPDVTEEKIRSARVDALVEYRIVDRVKTEAVRRLIAPAVAVGRFDLPLLRAAAGLPPARETGEPDEWNGALDEFTQLDWIYPRTYWFEVDAALLPRLRSYYHKAAPAELIASRRRAAEHLLTDARVRGPREIDGVYLDRMLASGPDQAQRTIEAWEHLVHRLVAHSGPAGVAQRTANLNGLDPDADPDERFAPTVARVVRVHRAAALGQLRSTREAIQLWDLLAEDPALKAPDSPADRRLARRTLGHRLAAWPREEGAATRRHQEELWDLLRTVTAAELDLSVLSALVAGVEGVVERAERTGETLDPKPAIRLSELSRKLGQDARPVAAFAEALSGRCLIAAPDGPRGRELIQQALGRVIRRRRPAAALIDWELPDNLPARLALERVRAGFRTGEGVHSILRALPEALVARLDPSKDIDQNRLAGAVIALKAAVEPMSASEFETRPPRSAPSWVSRCRAHETMPAAFVEYAKELTRIGQPADARKLVRRHAATSEQASRDYAIVEEADMVELWIARRMRWGDFGSRGYGFRSNSPDPTVLELRRAIEALGVAPEDVDLPSVPPDGQAIRHMYWRTYPAVNPDRREAAIAWADRTFSREPLDERSTAAEWAEALDRVEADRMAGRAVGAFPAVPDWPTLKARGWRPDAGFRVHIRAECLLGDASPAVRHLTDLLGLRQAAEIAFDEGELLALRLPGDGAVLLRRAAGWYDSCRDPVGGFLAATAVALATARADQETRAADLARRYQRLTATVHGLPPFFKLIESGLPEGKPDLLQAEWRPWLKRFAAVTAWTEGEGDFRRRWSRMTAQLVVEDERLPAEMSGWGYSRTRLPAADVLPPTFSVSEVTTAGPTTRPVVSMMDVILSYTGLSADGAFRTAVTDPIRIDPRDPVETWVASVRDALRESFRETAYRAWDDRYGLLRVETTTAWFPWEMVLLRSLIDLVPHSLDGFVREARGSRRAAWEPPGGEFVCLAATTADHSFAFQGWEGEPAFPAGFGPDRLAEAEIDLSQPLPRKVRYSIDVPPTSFGRSIEPMTVHLIGRFVESAGGVRVVLGDEKAEPFRAADVREWFGDRAFVILQQSPMPGPEWTITDVDQTRCLRAFAAELHASGVAGVTTLPPLDVQTAAAALLPFRSVLGRGGDFPAFVRAVEAARMVIAGNDPGPLEPRESGIVFHATGR